MSRARGKKAGKRKNGWRQGSERDEEARRRGLDSSRARERNEVRQLNAMGSGFPPLILLMRRMMVPAGPGAAAPGWVVAGAARTMGSGGVFTRMTQTLVVRAARIMPARMRAFGLAGPFSGTARMGIVPAMAGAVSARMGAMT